MRIPTVLLLASSTLLFACQSPKAPYSEPAPVEPVTIPLESGEPIGVAEGVAPELTDVTEQIAVEVAEVVEGPRYAYDEANPVLVGADELDGGPARERAYLNRLTGPEGQAITFARRGSCCPFDTPVSTFGGMLDIYEIMYEGLAEPVTIYVNMYDVGEALAPEGFVLLEE